MACCYSMFALLYHDEGWEEEEDQEEEDVTGGDAAQALEEDESSLVVQVQDEAGSMWKVYEKDPDDVTAKRITCHYEFRSSDSKGTAKAARRPKRTSFIITFAKISSCSSIVAGSRFEPWEFRWRHVRSGRASTWSSSRKNRSMKRPPGGGAVLRFLSRFDASRRPSLKISLL